MNQAKLTVLQTKDMNSLNMQLPPKNPQSKRATSMNKKVSQEGKRKKRNSNFIPNSRDIRNSSNAPRSSEQIQINQHEQQNPFLRKSPSPNPQIRGGRSLNREVSPFKGEGQIHLDTISGAHFIKQRSHSSHNEKSVPKEQQMVAANATVGNSSLLTFIQMGQMGYKKKQPLETGGNGYKQNKTSHNFKISSIIPVKKAMGNLERNGKHFLTSEGTDTIEDVLMKRKDADARATCGDWSTIQKQSDLSQSIGSIHNKRKSFEGTIGEWIIPSNVGGKKNAEGDQNTSENQRMTNKKGNAGDSNALKTPHEIGEFHLSRKPLSAIRIRSAKMTTSTQSLSGRNGSPHQEDNQTLKELSSRIVEEMSDSLKSIEFPESFTDKNQNIIQNYENVSKMKTRTISQTLTAHKKKNKLYQKKKTISFNLPLGEDGADADPKIGSEETKKVLKLQLMTKKHNWRDLVKNALTGEQYEEINLSFYDVIVEIYDGLIFNNQSKCLRELSFDFSENKYFNDDSLMFLSAIKLPNLEVVKINLCSTPCSRIGANFLLFDFNQVNSVEVQVGDMQSSKKLCYSRKDKFIEIDFSFQKTISKSEILSISEALFKTNHKHLKVNLSKVRDLTQEKLKLLGRCIQEVEELAVLLRGCELALHDLHYLIEGLNFMNTQTHFVETSGTLVKKPLSFWYKQAAGKGRRGQHEGEVDQSEAFSVKIENEFIKRLTIDFRSNKEDINAEFMNVFKQFKGLKALKLIIKPERQKHKQYEVHPSAFCLCENLKDSINEIEIAITEEKIIFGIDRQRRVMRVNASKCGVSPFQLVDIQKSLNMFENIIDLDLDLSGNWQISFAHLRKLFEKLVYFQTLQRLRLNIESVFIYEVEFITLFFLLKHIEDVKIRHDFSSAQLIDISEDESSMHLAFKGPFSRSKINNIHDMNEFCLALDAHQFPHLSEIQMSFFFNYGLRGDSLLRLCESLARLPALEVIDLNFNSCFLAFEDIVFLCDGLNQITSPVSSLKLTFTNNEHVTAISLMQLAKTLQRFPLLTSLEIFTETHELRLRHHDMTYAAIFNKFNTHVQPTRRPVKTKISLERVISRIYTIVQHDIEKSQLSQSQHLQPKQSMKIHQNHYLSQTQMGFRVPICDVNSKESGEQSKPQREMLSNNILEPQHLQPCQEIQPQQRRKIIKSAQQNWVSLTFKDDILYTDRELVNLGYNLALKDTLTHIITTPLQPILESVFKEVKAARRSVLFFSLILSPHIKDFDPSQILLDLYL